MFSPRWLKVLGDLHGDPVRALLAVLAVAICVFAVSAVGVARAILTREVPRNYLSTQPASATLHLDRVDPSLVAAARTRPGVADVAARFSILANVDAGSGWKPLVLFATPDTQRARIATVRLEQGRWPQGSAELVAERASLQVAGVRLGQTVRVRVQGSRVQALQVVGIVHDPAQSPGWMDGVVNAYTNADALPTLGVGGLDQLQIITDHPNDEAQVRAVAQDLARWLEARGQSVDEIQLPPPGRHPHQGQLDALLFLLKVFGWLTLLLGGVLLTTVVSALLSQQVRQIGVMKAIGATTRQIVALYLGFVVALEVAGSLLGLPLGVWVGVAGARFSAGQLNLELASVAVPADTLVTQGLVGLVVPLLVALSAILRGAEVTVRESLNDPGKRGIAPGGCLDALLDRVPGLSRPVRMSLRNTFRQRGRLLLTLGVLTLGGAFVLASLNVSAAWTRRAESAGAQRRFDVEVRLAEPAPAADVSAALKRVPGVTGVETWGATDSAVIKTGGTDVNRTYPGGLHGRFVILAPPTGTKLVRLPVLAGRWLRPGDGDVAVLNSAALRAQPGVKVGDRLRLRVGQREGRFRVVGIVGEELASGTAYVPFDAFARAAGRPGQATLFRLVTSRHDDAGRAAGAKRIERVLEQLGVPISYVLSTSDLNRATTDHILVLTTPLLIMALLMVVVGGVGLSTTLGVNVLERRREFGVLRAVGARGADVRTVVVTEGLVIGALSWSGAVALSVPLSLGLGVVMGQVGFGSPLGLTVTAHGVLGWLVLVLALAVVTSLVPARSAVRLSVQEALAYE